MTSRSTWTLAAGLIVVAVACSPTPTTAPTNAPASVLPALVTSPTPTPSSAATPAPTLGNPIDSAGVTRDGAIWAIGSNVLAVSTDLGSTWRRATLPTSGSEEAPSPTFVLDATHAWAITLTPGSLDTGNGPEFDHVHLLVNRTANGGQTWQAAVVPGDYPDTERSIVFVDPHRGYLMVSGGRTNGGSSTILKSDDGGATWTIVRTVQEGDQGALGALIAAPDRTTLWAAAQGEAGSVNHPILAVSRDSGRTWATATLPGVVSRWGGTQNLPLGPPVFLTQAVGLFALTSSDPATTGDSSGNARTLVYSTDDGGGRWTQRANEAFDANGAVAFISPTHWVVAEQGLPAALDVTTDGGATWEAVHPTGVPAGSFQRLAAIGANWLLGLVLVGGNSGGPQVLALSADGGATWQTIGQ